MTESLHLTDAQLGGAPHRAEIRIAEPVDDDLSYIRRTWLDSFHAAKDNCEKGIKRWKHGPLRTIVRLMEAPSTRILVARDPSSRFVREGDGRDLGPPVIGWLVWTPGRGISTVHYVYVRHKVNGVHWRRRGVMGLLFDAAGLLDAPERRIAYTHQGEYKIGSRYERRVRPLDEDVVEWLKRQGVTAVYEPIGEWLA
jgi:hypothetical protein